jgi:REP element-mobilizing transposase RayT
MANTYHQILVQTVFPVKYWKANLEKAWRDKLFLVIGNLINETGCHSIIINGVEDHVHCFFGLKPSVSVSEVMKNAKAKSSKWINESGFLDHHFEWQPGFGAFSYNRSQVKKVFNYIANQENHHQNQSFFDEYIEFLSKFDIDYDDKYLFSKLI